MSLRDFDLLSDGVSIYTSSRGGVRYCYYLQVRAKSVRQAIWLALNRISSTGPTVPGIVEVDHRDGPTEAKNFWGTNAAEAR